MASQKSKKFYITTPIYYVNDVPHIGHTYTTLAADIVARLHRQQENEVFFLTGTDEHGQKIAEEAEKHNLSPQQFCNQIAPRFQQAWKKMAISHDFFIRTTDPRHEQVASAFFQKLYDKGDLYKKSYEGLYCVGCEKFLTEKDLVGKTCPLHPPEKTVLQKEVNWFFRLSKYIPKLSELIQDDKTNYIFPEGKRREVLAKLRDPETKKRDQSFSRANVSWGIPVPWDREQTIYVWVEALINYYSATQFLPGKATFWPADVHLLAKDILWFHAVIWQAMLLAVDLPLPKRLYVHGYALLDEKKISKSQGRLIAPGELIDRYGVDGTRYLLASFFPTSADISISWEKFDERYNADLANNLGNLVSRLAKLAEQLKLSNVDFSNQTTCFAGVREAIDNLDLPRALSILVKKVDEINQVLNKEKPWSADPRDASALVFRLIGDLTSVAYQLKPFMPTTADQILHIFSGNIQALSAPLFPRLTTQTSTQHTSQAQTIEGVIIGKIQKVGKHPNADKLLVLQVETKKGEFHQIVCGDTSLKEGQIVPVAPPGASIIGQKGKLISVTAKDIRGITSQGVLCSKLELGIGNNHTKIHILPKGFEHYLGDFLERHL